MHWWGVRWRSGCMVGALGRTESWGWARPGHVQGGQHPEMGVGHAVTGLGLLEATQVNGKVRHDSVRTERDCLASRLWYLTLGSRSPDQPWPHSILSSPSMNSFPRPESFLCGLIVLVASDRGRTCLVTSEWPLQVHFPPNQLTQLGQLLEGFGGGILVRGGPCINGSLCPQVSINASFPVNTPIKIG